MEEISDMERVLFWTRHIENPCSIKINDREENIRNFYLREVRKMVMPTIKDEFAKEYLEIILKKYETHEN